jgi:hypothetical protein
VFALLHRRRDMPSHRRRSCLCMLPLAFITLPYTQVTLASTLPTAPKRTRVQNTSFVALRFHKVASTTFKGVIAAGFENVYMEHEALAAYKMGGPHQLRCLGAPTSPRVVFVTLFREPAARILSALYFYAGFAGASVFGVNTGLGRRLSVNGGKGLLAGYQKSPMAAIASVRSWIGQTPCSNYTAAAVSHQLDITFQAAKIGETYGGGMLLNEYSHYFGVRTKGDVPGALDRLRRDFVVGVTEDMSALVDQLVRYIGSPATREATAKAMKAKLNTNRAPTHHSTPPQIVAGSAAHSLGGGLKPETLARMGRSLAPAMSFTRNNYCSAHDLPPAVVSEVAKLGGHDVAIYAGALEIVEEQKHRSDAELRVHVYGRVFSGTEACRAALPPSPPQMAAEQPFAVHSTGDNGLGSSHSPQLVALGVICFLALIITCSISAAYLFQSGPWWHKHDAVHFAPVTRDDVGDGIEHEYS